MFWKQFLKFGVLPTLVFLVLFVYFYINSGKFRKLVIGAFMIVTYSLTNPTIPHTAGQAEGFTPQQQEQTSPSDRSGFFNSK